MLIDCGGRNQRRKLDSELREAGCEPGELKWVFLTHGDFDHCGNAAWLKENYGTQIALSEADVGMIRARDMSCGRKGIPAVARPFLPWIYAFKPEDQFEPDLLLTENTNLQRCGIDAAVIELPGHTKGSMAFLTAAGDLFCGDLLVSRRGVVLNSILDDEAAARASVEKIRGLACQTVYPGHGRPFERKDIRIT